MFSPYASALLIAKADRTEVVIGETFNLKISIDKNINEEPDLAELGKVFRILGNSQSTSTQIIQGKYSTEKSWQIVLMAYEEGTKVIPPIYLAGENSQPITIKVIKSDPNAKAEGDVFIEVSTDKASAFVKEQITLTVKLFYSIALSEGNLSDPIAKNALITMMDKSNSYNTQRDGKTYTVVERHFSIFAEKNGTLELNPIIFNGKDNSSRRNFSMFSTGKPVRAVSKPISMEIKPIPQQALGKEWLPASKVHISQQWSKGPYTAGEPITRTITLYVEGLTETQIPEIDLGEIDDIKVYPEQPQTQTENNATTIKSWKQVKMALIPVHEGPVRVPEYSLQWFNTTTQEFEFAKLPPMTLQVRPGAFAMDNPDINKQLDQLSQELNPKSTVTNKNNQETDKDAIDQVVIESSNPNYFWQIVSALLAALWLLTLIFYFKKPKKTIQQSTAKEVPLVSKKNVIAAINAKNIELLQKNLIHWWNHQNPEQTITNLSQLDGKIAPDSYLMVQEMQDLIYNSDESKSFDFEAFKSLINKNGFNIQKPNKINIGSELPQLY
jgi:hypothetical protein